MADINADGKEEIIFGRADGILVCLNEKGKTIWVKDLGHYIAGLSCGDINGDEKLEIAVITGDGKIFSLKDSGKRIWVKEYPREYAANDVILLDINNNDKEEILVAMKDGVVLGFDDKGNKVFEKQLLKESILHLKAGDLNDDREFELVLGGDNGTFMITDLSGKTLLQEKFSSKIIALGIFDINRDGYPEIIASDWDGTIKIMNFKGIITEKKAGREILADINGDGEKERIVRYWKKVIIYKEDKEIWSEEYARWVSAIDANDITGDGKSEIIIGDLDKVVRIYNGNKDLLTAFRTLRAPFSIYSSDFDKDGRKEIIVIGEREIRIYRVKVEASST